MKCGVGVPDRMSRRIRGDLADILESPAWCGLPVGEGEGPEALGKWLLAEAEKIEPEPAAADERPAWTSPNARRPDCRPRRSAMR